MLGLGSAGQFLLCEVISVPDKIMYPMIFILAGIGSYATRYARVRVGVCIGFGVIGWLFNAMVIRLRRSC
jgi:putative tricarboxylic transport membrane protein